MTKPPEPVPDAFERALALAIREVAARRGRRRETAELEPEPRRQDRSRPRTPE